MLASPTTGASGFGRVVDVGARRAFQSIPSPEPPANLAGALADPGAPSAVNPHGRRSIVRHASCQDGPVPRWWIACLLVACGPAAPTEGTTVVAAAVPCSAPPVTLRFAWPERVSAHVRGLDLTESSNADGSHPMRGESDQDLRMESVPDERGHAVRFVVVGRTRTRSQGFAPEIGGVRPVVVLGPDGSVQRVDGADLMRERMMELVRDGEFDAEARRHVEPNLTNDAQLATARSHWDWVTHVWNGREMRCGEPVRVRARIPAMGLGAGALEAEVTLVYERLGECPGARGRTCAALRAIQKADPSQVADALRARFTGSPGQLGGGAITRTVSVIVEPRTLLPHRVVFEEQQRLDWIDPRGNYSRLVRDVQAYELSYEGADGDRGTTILVGPGGGGYAVLGPDGRPVELPRTPSCTRFAACCQAAAARSSTVGLTCALLTGSAGDDCTEELEAVRSVILGGGGELPTECAPPAPTGPVPEGAI